MKHPFPNDTIRAVFDAFPAGTREMALTLRNLILDVAAENPAVGQVEEALRWGQPSYLTPETKSGSTLRIGVPKDGGCALFAHCQTNIVSSYTDQFPGVERVDGNRAVLFDQPSDIVPERLRLMIKHGLTYHSG